MSNPRPPETLLALHGFAQTGSSWRDVIASIPGERYRALAPDLRGHGGAAALRPVTFAACIGDLLALAPGRFALAGYSMGGRLALALALAAPERVSRLVLVSSSAGIEDEAERARRRESDEARALRLERDGLDRFVQEWESQPLFAHQTPAVRARANAERRRNDPAALAAALRGMGVGVMEPMWGRLGELTMPVAVVVGERDGRYVAVGERIAARIADARLVVVADAGHALTLEAPGAVAGAINALNRSTP